MDTRRSPDSPQRLERLLVRAQSALLGEGVEAIELLPQPGLGADDLSGLLLELGLGGLGGWGPRASSLRPRAQNPRGLRQLHQLRHGLDLGVAAGQRGPAAVQRVRPLPAGARRAAASRVGAGRRRAQADAEAEPQEGQLSSDISSVSHSSHMLCTKQALTTKSKMQR